MSDLRAERGEASDSLRQELGRILDDARERLTDLERRTLDRLAAHNRDRNG